MEFASQAVACCPHHDSTVSTRQLKLDNRLGFARVARLVFVCCFRFGDRGQLICGGWADKRSQLSIDPETLFIEVAKNVGGIVGLYRDAGCGQIRFSLIKQAPQAANPGVTMALENRKVLR